MNEGHAEVGAPQGFGREGRRVNLCSDVGVPGGQVVISSGVRARKDIYQPDNDVVWCPSLDMGP